ncbi:MAG: hypothetical protein HS126_21525 [Anaerolineales bacterium]|nr:hypothetical protein [Anaerolineales bacterium]
MIPLFASHFDRNAKRYVSECRQWPHFLDNLRAAQLAIEYTYRIGEAYGVNYTEVKHQDLFDRIFAALEAPLDPNVLLLGSGSEWWEVLGVSRTASRAEIVNAYRALAKSTILMWEATRRVQAAAGCV